MKSVRHVICRHCGGKRGFLSEHEAEKALGRAKGKRARQRGANIESRYYLCDEGLYHLTSESRRSFQSREFAYTG